MKICCCTLLGAVLATFGLRAEFVDRSGLTQQGELEAYVKAQGRTLAEGVYTVSRDLTIAGDETDRNGLSLAGKQVVIDVAPNVTLTVQGTNAIGRTGAGAGIHTSKGELLMLTGAGKVVVSGGNAARGTAGGDGGSPEWAEASVKLAAGGKGGDGGGGAGAAIGTPGGEGGVGAPGALPWVTNVTMAEILDKHDVPAEAVPEWIGKSPSSYGGNGQEFDVMNCSVLVCGQVNLVLTPGQTNTEENACGQCGSSLFKPVPGTDPVLYAAVGGGGGGGGGGNGQGAFPCGQGGAGGAGGGGGGSGALSCGKEGAFFSSAGDPLPIDPASAPHGGGGEGGALLGLTASEEASSVDVQVSSDTRSRFSGGPGSEAGETIEPHTTTAVMCSSGATVVATLGIVETQKPGSDVWGTGKIAFTDPDGVLASACPAAQDVFYRVPYAPIAPMTTTSGLRVSGWKTADDGVEVFDRNGQPVIEKWPWGTGKAVVPVLPSRHDRMLAISVNGQPIDDSTPEGASGTGWRYDTTAGILHLTGKGGEYRLSGTNEFGDVAVSVEANCTVSLDHLRLTALSNVLDGVIMIASGVEAELKCLGDGNLLSAGDVVGLTGVCCPLGARLTVSGPTGLYQYAPPEDYAEAMGSWSYAEGLDAGTPAQLVVRGGLRAAAIGGVTEQAACGRLTFADCILDLGNGGGANLLGCALDGTNRLTRAELRQCRPIVIGRTVSMRIADVRLPVVPAPHDPAGLPLYYQGSPHFIWLPAGRCFVGEAAQPIDVRHDTP